MRIPGDFSPDFSSPIGNVTAPVGREAVLTCAVTNLGAYKVGCLLHTHHNNYVYVLLD